MKKEILASVLTLGILSGSSAPEQVTAQQISDDPNYIQGRFVVLDVSSDQIPVQAEANLKNGISNFRLPVTLVCRVGESPTWSVQGFPKDDADRSEETKLLNDFDIPHIQFETPDAIVAFGCKNTAGKINSIFTLTNPTSDKFTYVRVGNPTSEAASEEGVSKFYAEMSSRSNTFDNVNHVFVNPSTEFRVDNTNGLIDPALKVYQAAPGSINFSFAPVASATPAIPAK